MKPLQSLDSRLVDASSGHQNGTSVRSDSNILEYNVHGVSVRPQIFLSEFNINDLPEAVRNFLSKKVTLEEVSCSSGATIRVAGSYIPPEKKDISGFEPLHLKIQASKKQNIDRAAQRIRVLVQHAMNLPKYKEKVLIGLEMAPPSFDVRGKVLGPGGANLQYITNETSAIVTLRGRSSGFIEPTTGLESIEPLHLCVEHNKYDILQAGRQLAFNLIETVQQEWFNYQQQHQPPTPSSMHSSQPSSQAISAVVSSSGSSPVVCESVGYSTTHMVSVPPPTAVTTSIPPPPPPPLLSVPPPTHVLPPPSATSQQAQTLQLASNLNQLVQGPPPQLQQDLSQPPPSSVQQQVLQPPPQPQQSLQPPPQPQQSLQPPPQPQQTLQPPPQPQQSLQPQQGVQSQQTVQQQQLLQQQVLQQPPPTQQPQSIQSHQGIHQQQQTLQQALQAQGILQPATVQQQSIQHQQGVQLQHTLQQQALQQTFHQQALQQQNLQQSQLHQQSITSQSNPPPTTNIQEIPTHVYTNGTSGQVVAAPNILTQQVIPQVLTQQPQIIAQTSYPLQYMQGGQMMVYPATAVRGADGTSTGGVMLLQYQQPGQTLRGTQAPQIVRPIIQPQIVQIVNPQTGQVQHIIQQFQPQATILPQPQIISPQQLQFTQIPQPQPIHILGSTSQGMLPTSSGQSVVVSTGQASQPPQLLAVRPVQGQKRRYEATDQPISQSFTQQQQQAVVTVIGVNEVQDQSQHISKKGIGNEAQKNPRESPSVQNSTQTDSNNKMILTTVHQDDPDHQTSQGDIKPESAKKVRTTQVENESDAGREIKDKIVYSYGGGKPFSHLVNSQQQQQVMCGLLQQQPTSVTQQPPQTVQLQQYSTPPPQHPYAHPPYYHPGTYPPYNSWSVTPSNQ